MTICLNLTTDNEAPIGQDWHSLLATLTIAPKALAVLALQSYDAASHHRFANDPSIHR